LAPQIHFVKYRIKDVEHLREKLVRKRLEAKEHNRQDVIDKSNLFEKVNDLAGIRIIHLHTDQFRQIHEAILGILDEQQCRLVEEPTIQPSLLVTPVETS
jgi:ppGpp synthetase/RelA/SpoT-type nucleotidyltranferase